MKIISGGRVLKRGVLLYRKVRYRKGHGVHSPFVFRFITKVIDERASFYCQNEIELTKRKMAYQDTVYALPDKKNPGTTKEWSANDILEKIAIKPRSGALLTRIMNYFKPQTILQIGCSGGLSTLYLSAYSAEAHCIALEENKEMADFARSVFDKHGSKNICLKQGLYRQTLPETLAEAKSIDLLYLDTHNDIALNTSTIEQSLPCLHSKSILVVAGIRASAEREKQWRQLCQRHETGVTVDVYEFGIVFFDKNLHKRNYIVSF